MEQIGGSKGRGDISSPQIDFKILKEEFSLKKIWRDRTLNHFFGHFARVLLIGLVPSFFDLFTDSLNAKNFIFGTFYTKQIQNMTEFNRDICKHVGTYIRYTTTTELNSSSEDLCISKFSTDLKKPEVVYEEVSCFEVDKIWGWLTFVFILLPGFGLSLNIAMWINSKKNTNKGWALIPLILPFACASFPFILVLVKLVTLVNAGPEWEKVANSITALEGRWESSFQLILTLFIILSRADRTPTVLQIASLVASLLMIIKVSASNFVKEDSAENQLQMIISLAPFFLTVTIFKFGSVAITTALLRYYTIPLYIAVFILFHVISAWCKSKTKCKKPSSPGFSTVVDGALGFTKFRTYIGHNSLIHKTERQVLEDLLFRNKFWFTVHILVLVLLVLDINAFSFFILNFLNKKDHILKDETLSQKVFASILGCGLTSIVLFYIQIWRPETKKCKGLQQGEEVSSQCYSAILTFLI